MRRCILPRAVVAGLALLGGLTRSVAAHSASNSVFYLNKCEKDGPCCVEGYLGLAEGGHVTLNVAGFDPTCGPDLVWGFDEVFFHVVDVSLINGFPASTELNIGTIRVPHPEGVEEMTVSLMQGGGIQLKSTEQRPMLGTVSGKRMTTLAEGVIDGTVRDPRVEAAASGKTLVDPTASSAGTYTAGIDGTALGFGLAFLFGVVFYILFGFLWVRRNGGSWDGPCDHVHGNRLRLCMGSVPCCRREAMVEKMAVLRRSSSISTVSSTLKAFKARWRGGADQVENSDNVQDGAVISRVVSFSSSPKKQPSHPGQNTVVVAYNENEQEGMEDVNIDLPAEPEGSGSPSKARRPKRIGEWRFGLKPIPMRGLESSGTSSSAPVAPSSSTSASVVAAAADAPRAVPSPGGDGANRRRGSLSQRTAAVQQETRGELV